MGGTNRTVNIYDRHGEIVDDISLPGSCTGLKWDIQGNTLAIIQVSIACNLSQELIEINYIIKKSF